MPKMKTNKSAAKRFKITGSGKVKKNSAYKRHILAKKSPAQKRRYNKGSLLAKCDENAVKRMLRLK